MIIFNIIMSIVGVAVCLVTHQYVGAVWAFCSFLAWCNVYLMED